MDIFIPKTFQLFGHTFKVVQPPKVDAQKSLGECNSSTNIIKLRRSLKKESKEQVYLHELVHAILDSLSYDELSDDEVFVDQFSKALHQILKSSK